MQLATGSNKNYNIETLPLIHHMKSVSTDICHPRNTGMNQLWCTN